MKLTLPITIALVVALACSTEAWAPNYIEDSDSLTHEFDSLLEELSQFQEFSSRPKTRPAGQNLIAELEAIFRAARKDRVQASPANLLKAARDLKRAERGWFRNAPPKRKPHRGRHMMACASSKFRPGEHVDVMVLSHGERVSDEWIPGTVKSVSCDGRYNLLNKDGSPITPALESGIREEHLRQPSRRSRCSQSFKALSESAKKKAQTRGQGNHTLPRSTNSTRIGTAANLTQNSTRNGCVIPKHKAGEAVEVMVLSDGEETSNEWRPAVVHTVSCDGKYHLLNQFGHPITPALETGIEAKHLRSKPKCPGCSKCRGAHATSSQRPNGTPCVSTTHKPGDHVEVMALGGSSVHWRPASVTNVSCDGRYSLKDEHGSPIQPVLKSGIRDEHLRELTPEAALARRVRDAQVLLEQAKQAQEQHRISQQTAAFRNAQAQARQARVKASSQAVKKQKARYDAAEEAFKETAAQESTIKHKLGELEQEINQAHAAWEQASTEYRCAAFCCDPDAKSELRASGWCLRCACEAA